METTAKRAMPGAVGVGVAEESESLSKEETEAATTARRDGHPWWVVLRIFRPRLDGRLPVTP
jgi:hypothetical protein